MKFFHLCRRENELRFDLCLLGTTVSLTEFIFKSQSSHSLPIILLNKTDSNVRQIWEHRGCSTLMKIGSVHQYMNWNYSIALPIHTPCTVWEIFAGHLSLRSKEAKKCLWNGCWFFFWKKKKGAHNFKLHFGRETNNAFVGEAPSTDNLSSLTLACCSVNSVPFTGILLHRLST